MPNYLLLSRMKKVGCALYFFSSVFENTSDFSCDFQENYGADSRIFLLLRIETFKRIRTRIYFLIGFLDNVVAYVRFGIKLKMNKL